ncbi:DR1-associated protein 1 (negative cofactor 2 alpha) [Cichlidogyrus casuarinus]|uniref:DR1-associated protein 1 (Negative cofactor 2 alpha) n=1 Tax=Cichlidogyrus casuarinus TaxID=1844966 RepID=A0ABD2QNT6_9PLAT
MTKSYRLTEDKSSRTILPSYLKHIIETTPSFDFLKPLVANVADFKQEKSESNNTENPSASKRGRPRRSVNENISHKKSELYKRSISSNDTNNDSDSIEHGRHPKKFRITFRRDPNSTSVESSLADDQNYKSLSYTSHFDPQVCLDNSEHAHDQF